MEYLLKHPKYSHLKESLLSPAVLCPTKPESLQLVCSLIDNILNAQPEAKYIHIGADEVRENLLASHNLLLFPIK